MRRLRITAKAIELDPTWAGAHYGLGNVFTKKDRLDEAITNYSKAIELEPTWVDAYNRRGNAHYSKGELNEAITDFRKTIDLDPTWAVGYYNLGLALEKAAEELRATDGLQAVELSLQDACAAFEEARRLAPDDTAYADAVARVNGKLPNSKRCTSGW